MLINASLPELGHAIRNFFCLVGMPAKTVVYCMRRGLLPTALLHIFLLTMVLIVSSCTVAGSWQLIWSTSRINTQDKMFIGFPMWTISSQFIAGYALFLLLTFRTQSVYERWWEGRKQLGSINCATRDIGRYCVSKLLIVLLLCSHTLPRHCLRGLKALRDHAE